MIDSIYFNSGITSTSRSSQRESIGRLLAKRFIAKNAPDAIYRHRKYRFCEFLNNQMVVLARNDSGFDILKIADTTPTPVFRSDGHNRGDPSQIRRLWGGTSFAMGMRCGSLNIYDTEYSKLIMKEKRDPQMTEFPLEYLDVQCSAEMQLFQRETNQLFIRRGRRARRPLRKYNKGAHSLGEEYDDPSLPSTNNLVAVPEWDCPRTDRSQCGGWDFREHGASRLWAISSASDHLSITMVDSRSDLSKIAICFDDGRQDHVWGEPCFLSDTLIASTVVGENRLYRNSIAIWDVRLPKQPVHSRKILPSFPKEMPLELQARVIKHPRKRKTSLTPLLPNQLLVRSVDEVVGFTFTVWDAQLRELSTICSTMWPCFAANSTSGLLALSEDRNVINFHSLNSGQQTGRKRRRSPEFSMRAEMTDGFGLSTYPESLVFSPDGSCLAGVTRDDNDFFAWRA